MRIIYLAVLTLSVLMLTQARLHGEPLSGADHSAHMYKSAARESPAISGLDIVTEFDLIGGAGEQVTLEDFRGKYLMLGFGFTHCEHVCPTMAANMASALRKSDKSSFAVLISVDTERDTPAITHSYAQKFHHKLIGLSGSYKSVAAVANNFKVSFSVTKTQNNYTVQHAAYIYLIDPGGKLQDIFPINVSADRLIAAMN